MLWQRSSSSRPVSVSYIGAADAAYPLRRTCSITMRMFALSASLS